MVIFTKDALYNFLLKQYKINEEQDDEKKRLYQSNLEEFVDEIYDMSKTTVSPLNEKTTFIFRKRYGVFDEGVCQTQCSIGEEFGVSRAAIYEVLKKIELVLPKRIKKEPLQIVGFSVFDIYEDKKHLKNLPVTELGIPTQSGSRLIKRGILTLEDLLNYSFRNLFSYKMVGQSRVAEAVHNLGLKFIDEIPYRERKKLFIKCSDRDKVVNSDISWLGIDHNLEIKLMKYGINKIKDLYTFNINIGAINKVLEKFGNELSNEMADISKSSTLDALNAVNDNKKASQNVAVNDLNFSTRAINALSILGITDIKDVTNIVRQDLLSIPYVGTTVFTEIVRKAHSCGVKFLDELSEEETMLYLKELEESLSEEKQNDLNTSINEMNLSNRSYNALSKAKIRNMKQLIVISTADLIRLKGIGEKSYQELVDKVHSYGFLFIDEEIKSRMLKKGQVGSVIERVNQVYSKYSDLTTEKNKLLLRNSELDSEIATEITRLHGSSPKDIKVKTKINN